MSIQQKALLAGWIGSAVSVASWIAIESISPRFFPLWIALMTMGAVLCVYASLRRSRWFWLPVIATILVTAAVLSAASHPEP